MNERMSEWPITNIPISRNSESMCDRNLFSSLSRLGGEESVGSQDFSVLPFGPIEDPVRHLTLSTTWPRLSEHLVTETESYSDLDPLQVIDRVYRSLSSSVGPLVCR